MSTEENKAHEYVIYARKSVDEKGKEEKSVDQQIKYCQELAERYGLNVVREPIKEEYSAKKSGARKKFNKMLQDIDNGMYDGIISWHPDRLARNMGDGGRIIEMVDEHVISDLKFCTQQFSKDANGKMLLGLSFVLSKQYSDKLSQDVIRGNLEKHLAGKAIGRFKAGYEIDENGRYQKSQYWGIIRKAWKMRIEGKQQVEICDWVNKNGYERVTKKNKKIQFMDTSKLSRLFRDSIYYGQMYLNGEHPVYLPVLYDFPAMVTEEEFITVQRLGRIHENTKQKKLYWLRGKVFDSQYPDLIEYKPGISRGKTKKYMHFAVDSHHKKRIAQEDRSSLKAVRALKIVEALKEVFTQMRSDYSQKEYGAFLDSAKKYMDERSAELALDMRNYRQSRTKAKNELHALEIGFMKMNDKNQKSRKAAFEKEVKKLEKEIKAFTEMIRDSEQEDENLFPTFKKFSNTMRTLSQSYEMLEPEAMLAIAEIMVSNIFVHNGKAVEVRLKPPFDSLFPSKIELGWG